MRCLRVQQLTLFLGLCYQLCSAGRITVFGYEGREIQVSCSYPNGYEGYEKYLCRYNCNNDNDVLITTTIATKDRYSITDDTERRIYITTISDLRRTDAGTYWCGVSRTGADIYTEVKMQVKKDSCCDQNITVQGHEEDSVSFDCPYKSEHQNNRKYMCRGTQPSTCLQHALITSDNIQKGSFSLIDDKAKGKFTVTIARLTQSDSGLYLCGVQRKTGLDVFSAVELKVKEWCSVNSSEVSGTVGRPFTLHCSYPPEHRDNRKFLCKGDKRKDCEDIVTGQSRISLQDEVSENYFLVRISELKAEDAGTYWCGSDIQGTTGQCVKIHLSLDFPQQTTTGAEPTNSPAEPVQDTTLFLYVGVTVLTVLFVLTVSLVIYKCKGRNVRGTQVAMKRNKLKKAGEQVYGNQEVVDRAQAGTSTQCATHHKFDKAEDQLDSEYQNYTTEEIYCNETYIKAKR